MYAARSRGDAGKWSDIHCKTGICSRGGRGNSKRDVRRGHKEAKDQDIIIKAAAVADYRPKSVSSEKMKKKDDDLAIPMERTDDILKFLGEHKKEHQFLCGFSMETENMLENSRKKLEKKHLDMIVANNLKVEGAGFAGDTNVVTIITGQEEVSLGKMTKEETALRILDEILKSNKLIWRQNKNSVPISIVSRKRMITRRQFMNQTTNKTQTTGSSVRTRHMVQTAIFGVIIVIMRSPLFSDISRWDLQEQRLSIFR